MTGDDPAKAAACQALFERVRVGTEVVLTNEAMIAEVVYVLSSRATGYGLAAHEIRDKLASLVRYPNLKLMNKRVILRALDLATVYPALDFEDVLALAYMERQGVTELLSYDRDFDRVAAIDR
ncbi:MAG: PIN domain-containing protein [Chloroflexi bacterium]|nr:PIN domain-containing protein [Chloroflexota bacterium]